MKREETAARETFKGMLFNLFTRYGCSPKKQRMYFSSRMIVVNAMLKAMDAEIAKWEAERALAGR